MTNVSSTTVFRMIHSLMRNLQNGILWILIIINFTLVVVYVRRPCYYKESKERSDVSLLANTGNLSKIPKELDQWHPRTPTSGACVPESCVLPACFCPGTSGPPNMATEEIPQMIMLTFDDGLNEEVGLFLYELLLKTPRLNPNGCPISATFYVTELNSDYQVIKRMYGAGHEMALHSLSHRSPETWWTEASHEGWYHEINNLRVNLVNKADIHKSHIRGSRSPFLVTGGDLSYEVISELGLTYDATLITGPHAEGGIWPYTLDYPPEKEFCTNSRCPTKGFPGLWELPNNRWYSPNDEKCVMADFCPTPPVDKNDTLGYFWYNFKRSYHRNRAPFGIHLHARSFLNQESQYFAALVTFLDLVAKYDDVYVVSASQVIDWMVQPTSLTHIKSFQPWRTHCGP